jgi:hypothetical protein
MELARKWGWTPYYLGYFRKREMEFSYGNNRSKTRERSSSLVKFMMIFP